MIVEQPPATPGLLNIRVPIYPTVKNMYYAPIFRDKFGGVEPVVIWRTISVMPDTKGPTYYSSEV